jgi:integrase
LRLGELLSLRWREIDFGREAIRVRRSYNAHGGLTTPKSGKVRSVPMVLDVARALAALADLEEFTGEEDLVSPAGLACSRTRAHCGSVTRRRSTAPACDRSAFTNMPMSSLCRCR